MWLYLYFHDCFMGLNFIQNIRILSKCNWLINRSILTFALWAVHTKHILLWINIGCKNGSLCNTI